MSDPVTLPLSVKRGADLYIEIECFQGDGVTPLDISTFDFYGDVKADPNSGVVKPLTVGCKIGTTNVLQIDMPSAVSADIPAPGKTLTETAIYWYDIKVDTGSEVEYWYQGPFIVTPRVTV
jgi:hypothetical protein